MVTSAFVGTYVVKLPTSRLERSPLARRTHSRASGGQHV